MTSVGRAFGAGVMILGIGIFALLAASLASFFIARGFLGRQDDPQMDRIEERLTRIESLLEGMQSSPNGDRDQLAAEGSADPS